MDGLKYGHWTITCISEYSKVLQKYNYRQLYIKLTQSGIEERPREIIQKEQDSFSNHGILPVY